MVHKKEKKNEKPGKIAFGRGVIAQKMTFSIKDFFSKCDQIRSPADLITFTEEICHGKLHFLYYLLFSLKVISYNDDVSRVAIAPKMKFSIKYFFSECGHIRRYADLVTFTEEIHNGKLHFLCSDRHFQALHNRHLTQPAFTCSKLKWKHQNNVWRFFKFNNKDTKTRLMKPFWWLYC